MKFATRRIPRSLSRNLKIFALILLFAGAAAAFVFRGPVSEADTPAYPAATVVTGDIEENVTSQGKLEPKEYVDIGVQVTRSVKKDLCGNRG